DRILLENLLIGKGFQWEKSISVTLPGIVREPDDNDFPLINILPIEEYLKCVVGSEMNPRSPIEFLKAHAIISRSWALGKILHSHPEGGSKTDCTGDSLIGWDDTADHLRFDVCSDDHCQRYQGLQEVSEKALASLSLTEGMVITDKKGKLIDARFSKCCGGKTEIFSTCWQEQKMPCLESVEDPWCDLTQLSKKEQLNILSLIYKEYDLSTQGGYEWETNIKKEEIRKNLSQKFRRDIGEIISLRIIERGASGRIKYIELTGTEGRITVGKELWIRRILSPTHLYSSWFNIQDKGDYLNLKGKGWGHGVGLCQLGAARMALEGKTAEEILQFYYPGSKIVEAGGVRL
ncbi:MAG: SpoIID/LytB domain-containing protein, partial [Muribaculaceae bacterium]|nr:SpoIID/LytB domain-containing protein [Muribaculaceae bacterium]